MKTCYSRKLQPMARSWSTFMTQKLGQIVRQLLLSLVLSVFVWVMSPVERLDTLWSDIFLSSQAVEMPSRILVVNVTADDVIAHGMERLSRKHIASSLALLAEGKVQRVLMDFNMAAQITPEEEAAMLSALKLLGPLRVGFGYEAYSALLPGKQLLSEATVLNLSLNPSHDGRVRSIGGSNKNEIPNPCIWLSTGIVNSQSSPIDLRYDPRKIQRVSFSELYAGKIPMEQLKDRIVIIAHDRELSRTRTTLPLYGPTDRGTVLAMGTASVLSDYSLKYERLMRVLSIISAVITMVSFIVGYKAHTITGLFVGFVRLFGCIMFISWCGSWLGGVPTKPASLALTAFAVIGVSVAQRLKVLELFKGLLSGVLSPEEVWVWRTYSDREAPVLLFDAMGCIKKANSAAVVEFQLNPNTLNQNISTLAKKCMPSLGERSKRVIVEENVRKLWDVEWPSPHLPIAIFTDVTDQQNQLDELHAKLTTDPLTGALNRKGFELALKKIERQQPGKYTVFFMDMNGFKAVNDRYGHGAGDTLLKITAERFQQAMSPDDFVARFGGDEFAILIPKRLSPDEAVSIRDHIESTLIPKIDVGAALVQVGVAAGFAIPFDENEETDSILDRADHEMYDRKVFLKKQSPALVAAR